MSLWNCFRSLGNDVSAGEQTEPISSIDFHDVPLKIQSADLPGIRRQVYELIHDAQLEHRTSPCFCKWADKRLLELSNV